MTCPLTNQQLDILRHAPLTTDEIARQLHFGYGTIQNYLRDIGNVLLSPGDPREKRRSKAMLMALALQAGYITAEELVTLPSSAARCADTNGGQP